MAESADAEVLRPSLNGWRFFEAEDRLRKSRTAIPHLKLANTMRRFLAAVTLELGNRQLYYGQVEMKALNEGDLMRASVSQLAILGVRAASAALSLTASGYEVEAHPHLRRLLECNLRARAVLDDRSAEHARQWLRGRATPKVERLAQKYGTAEDVAFFSITAHADARGVPMLWAEEIANDGVQGIPLMPHHRDDATGVITYAIAYECGALSVQLAEAFGVGVMLPAWAEAEMSAAKAAIAERLEGRA